MAKRFKQFLVYTRVTIVVLLLAGIALIVVKNWGYKTKFWPGAAEAEVPTLWLMLGTGMSSIVASWIFSRMRRVFSDYAALRAEQARERSHAEEEQRREELDRQERRIDEKIKKAIGDEDPKPGA